MEEWVVETTYVAKWNQRKDSDNDEKDDGMGEKCCDADGEISECSMLIFYEELHKVVHYH